MLWPINLLQFRLLVSNHWTQSREQQEGHVAVLSPALVITGLCVPVDSQVNHRYKYLLFLICLFLWGGWW